MIITEYKGIQNVKSMKVNDVSWQDFCFKCSHPIRYGMMLSDYVKESFPDTFTADDYAKAKAEGKRIEWFDSRNGIKGHNGSYIAGEAIVPEGQEAGRKKDFFHSRCAITFDYEHCGSDIFERIKKLNEWKYCYYTTIKHNPPDDYRLRIVIPFAEPVDEKLFYIITAEFANKIGTDGIDKTCIQTSRMMCYPVVLKKNENEWNDFQFHANDGQLLDVEKYLAEKYDSVDSKALTKKIGIDWSWWNCRDMNEYCREIVVKEKTTGKHKISYSVSTYFRPKTKTMAGDVKSCFNAVFSVREILRMSNKFDECGDRFKKSGSHSTPGVCMNFDETLAWTFHDRDGLSERKAWDAFELYLKLFTDEKLSFRERRQIAHEFAIKRKGEKYMNIFGNYSAGRSKLWKVML